MPHLRISEAASLLGVSDDTVRRWVSTGRLPSAVSDGGRMTIEGSALAVLAKEQAPSGEGRGAARESARNRLHGIVTAVTRDTVMAQVELQAGPFRVVSLMSREACDELALEVGVVAVAVVKATNVIVEVPDGDRRAARGEA